MPKKSVLWRSSIKPALRGGQKRIVVPQPEKRPVRVEKDVMRWALIQPAPYWLTVHKRTRRSNIGDDQNELRAKQGITGYLHERMVYFALETWLHMMPGADFTFQSPSEGGRQELGGLIVDFLFPNKMMIIQVQGVSHEGFIRHRKDEEQQSILEEMGYKVYYLDIPTIEDIYALDEWLRRVFDIAGTATGSSQGASYIAADETTDSAEGLDLSYFLAKAPLLLQKLESYV